MKSDFKLVGLSVSGTATLELLHTDKETIWAPLNMSKDRIAALFKWAKEDDGFWSDRKIAEVDCDYLDLDGLPINPKVVVIRTWDL